MYNDYIFHRTLTGNRMMKPGGMSLDTNKVMWLMLQLAMCWDKSQLWFLVIHGSQTETANSDPLDLAPANSKYQVISISSTL